MTASQLLAAFVGDRVMRIEQTRTASDVARGGFSIHVLFESGRSLTFPITAEFGFAFDDEGRAATPSSHTLRAPGEETHPMRTDSRLSSSAAADASTDEEQVAPVDVHGVITEQGVAAYPTEEALRSEWEQDATTGTWRRRKT